MDENLQRLSQDKIVNMNCRKLLECCEMHDLRICYGRLDSDIGIGKYTYVGSSRKTVVDYILVNPFLLKFFSTFEVCEPNILSDHCDVQFSLKVKSYLKTEKIDTHSFANVNKRYALDVEKAGQYEYKLLLNDEKFAEFNTHLQQVTSSQHKTKILRISIF